MSQEIISVLDNISERFGVAVDWSSKNIIPYLKELCQKIVVYRALTAMLVILICLIVITLGLTLGVKFVKYCIKRDKEDEFSGWDMAAVYSFTAITIIIVVSCIILVYKVYTLIDCAVIPEKVILDFLRGYK